MMQTASFLATDQLLRWYLSKRITLLLYSVQRRARSGDSLGIRSLFGSQDSQRFEMTGIHYCRHLRVIHLRSTQWHFHQMARWLPLHLTTAQLGSGIQGQERRA